MNHTPTLKFFTVTGLAKELKRSPNGVGKALARLQIQPAARIDSRHDVYDSLAADQLKTSMRGGRRDEA